MIQDCGQDLQRALAPFNVSFRQRVGRRCQHIIEQVELDFIYAVRLCHVLTLARGFNVDPILERIPIARYARFDCERPDRPVGCFKGTRVAIIREIVDWIINPDSERLFWLNGLGGIGKTVIAYTIAKLAHYLGILGASFLFSRRGEAELRNPALVFPTIAYQLALLDPTFSEHITEVLKSDPQAPTASLERQLDSLIIQPLSNVERDSSRVVVVVLDGFDECEARGGDVILQLLVDAIPRLPSFLKIFITSRPEPHIRSILAPSNHNLHITRLHDVEPSIIKGDILSYLRAGIRALPEKKGLFMQLDWVADEEIGLLAEAAGELFLYAATLLRALEGAFGLQQQLDFLLQLAIKQLSGRAGSSGSFIRLDEFYAMALQAALRGSNTVETPRLFQVALGSLVSLRTDLPVDALAHLVGMEEWELWSVFSSLRSLVVLPSPSNPCPKIHHKSFAEFLQDPHRCTDTQLFVDTKKNEQWMTLRCLELMNSTLRKGMIGGVSSSLPNREIEGLQGRIAAAYPQEIQYASVRWASHLAACPSGNIDIEAALRIFAYTCLLPWMEVMSWLGASRTALGSLRLINKWTVRLLPNLIRIFRR